MKALGQATTIKHGKGYRLTVTRDDVRVIPLQWVLCDVHVGLHIHRVSCRPAPVYNYEEW